MGAVISSVVSPLLLVAVGIAVSYGASKSSKCKKAKNTQIIVAVISFISAIILAGIAIIAL